MRRTILLLIPALVLVVSACTAADGEGRTRTVDVRMSDDMRYDPDSFTFRAGDTVTFRVQNAGQIRHEFFIGTLDEHREHAEEMRETDHSEDAHANPAAVSVEPGATGTLTYSFEEAGQLLVGCHEPGHYEAGMAAPVTVHR